MSAETPEELAEEVISYGVVLVFAILMVYVVYSILEATLGELPAVVSSILVGLCGFYVVVVNKRVRRSLLDWLREGKR